MTTGGQHVAGRLELDGAGTSALVRDLRLHAADSDDQAGRADAALAAAAGAVTSSPVSGAMERLVGRFSGHGARVGQRMTSLGAAVTTAASAVAATDGDLAAIIRRSDG